MKSFWSNLKRREQVVVIFGGICIFLYIFCYFFYYPLNSKIDRNAEKLFVAHKTLLWMQKAKEQYGIKKRVIILSPAHLASVLAKELSSKLLGSYHYKLQQTNHGEISLSYERIAFTVFVNWLWEFQEKYAVTIKQFDVTSTEQSGIVKMNLILSAN